MAFWVYSVEGFPSSGDDGDSGRPTEYVRMLGHQLVIPRLTWFKLDRRYEHRYYTDFRDKQGRSDINTADEIAEAILNHQLLNWNLQDGKKRTQVTDRGVVVIEMTDHPDGNPKVRDKLEAQAKEVNLVWRKKFCEGFERILAKSKSTGFGRLDPSEYETECYKLLERPLPDSFEERQRSVTVNVPQQQSMSVADLIKAIQSMDDETIAKIRGGEKVAKAPTIFDEVKADLGEPVPGESVGRAAQAG